MSSLVKLDAEGIIGPALTLVFHAGEYNKGQVSELSTLLKGNYIKLAHSKPKGRKEFCTFVESKDDGKGITAAKIVSTRFFQNMEKPHDQAQYHARLIKSVAPNMLNSFQKEMEGNLDEANGVIVQKWIAWVLESYLSAERIEGYCKTSESTSPEFKQAREKVGRSIYKAAEDGKINENDLNRILSASRAVLAAANKSDNEKEIFHEKEILKYTTEYLQLFAMDSTPSSTGEELLKSLSTAFRQKFWPKEKKVETTKLTDAEKFVQDRVNMM